MRLSTHPQVVALQSASSLVSLAPGSGTAANGVRIRDFAYPVSDPRHWGGHGMPLSKAPTKSSLNLSSSRTQSSTQLDKQECKTPAVESFKTQGSTGQAAADEDMTRGDATSMDEDDEDDDANYIMFKDEVSCYLPRAMSILDQHSSMGPIRLAKKKVLYNFSKVTEWEMDIRSSEIVVVAHLPGGIGETDTKQADKVSNDPKPLDDGNDAEMGRWASIEEDDDENLSSLSAQTSKDQPTRDPMSHMPVISLIPEPPSFVEQLKEFIDYQPVYGSGWVTAIKVRVKEDWKGSTRLQMLDIGLVPTTYSSKIVSKSKQMERHDTVKAFLKEGTIFSIPCEAGNCDDGDSDSDVRPEGDDSLAADLDRTAKSEVLSSLDKFGIPAFPKLQDVLESINKIEGLARHLDALCLRSTSLFMASVIGHMPYNIVKVLVSIVFFNGSRNADPTVIEYFLAHAAAGQAFTPSKQNRRIAKHLLNSDALHQSLLRSARTLMSNFSSPHAMTEECMPAFSIFDSHNNNSARSGFLHRPLDAKEAMHPILNALSSPNVEDEIKGSKTSRISPSKLWHELTDTGLMSTSVVPNLAMFKRAFQVFTCGLLDKVDLGKDRAIVAGGAVSACLMPWPKDLYDLWQQECVCRDILERRIGLPYEIAKLIERYSAEIRRREQRLDIALMKHFSTEECPYMGSDIDVFFICPPGSVDVAYAATNLPKLHSQIVKNRQEIDLSVYPLRSCPIWKKHWLSSLQYELGDAKGDPTSDYYWMLLHGDEEEYPDSDLVMDQKGWSPAMKLAVKSRLKYLWTVRTTNSITICGVHPIRHTQLMMMVVRSPEQVVYPFDLDCVAVYYDGDNVYATDRAMRSFNTRTNFVDVRSLADRARATRMVKYATRGFSTLVFETCRHTPRCDVELSQSIKDVLLRQFPKLVAYDESMKEMNFNEYEGTFIRFHPDRGNPELEPFTLSLGMDYVTTPLIYGPASDASDLMDQINFYEDPYFVDELSIKAGHMLLSRLKYKLTSNHSNFKNSILEPHNRLIPMQFKHVKDSWLGRRIRFATAFHLCYMCGRDVGVGLEECFTKIEEIEEEKGEADQKDTRESESKSNDSDEESLQPPDSPKKVALCTHCSTLNETKRNQRADLTGKYALVTGGRIKIGRSVSLKLLRCGATVLITTRFPMLLLKTFRDLPDSADWWDRLRVYGLDFRNVGEVMKFAEHLKGPEGIPRLDIFVQNAAQTIWRPAEYYRPMVVAEVELGMSLEEDVRNKW
ncbi:hypothetical protein HDU67_002358, partial [Dinochytrium kinnereticum]